MPHSTSPIQGDQRLASIRVEDHNIAVEMDVSNRLCILWKPRLLLPGMTSDLGEHPREVELAPSNESFTIYSKPIAFPLNGCPLFQVAAKVVIHRTGIEVGRVYVAQALPQNDVMMRHIRTHTHRDEIVCSIIVKCHLQERITYSYWTIG